MKPSIALLIVLASGPAWAQVSAPFLGYFPDGNLIRPAHGIAASASVGAAMEAGDFSLVQAMPGQGYLLTVATGTGQVSLLRPGVGARPLPGTGYAPDAIFPSPAGTAAALWFGASQRIQVIANLAGEPAVRHAAFVQDRPRALAVSDDGSWLAGLWDGKLRTFGPHGETSEAGLQSAATAVAFEVGSHDLALATSRGIVRLSGLGAQPDFTLLHPSADAVAIAFTGDNRSLVALTGLGDLLAIRTADGSAVRRECACGADQLVRIARSTFRASGLKHNAYLLFDGDSGDILVAPVAASAGRNAGE